MQYKNEITCNVCWVIKYNIYKPYDLILLYTNILYIIAI